MTGLHLDGGRNEVKGLHASKLSQEEMRAQRVEERMQDGWGERGLFLLSRLQGDPKLC